MTGVLDEAQARRIARAALGRATAKEVVIGLTGSRLRHLRAAAGELTTSGDAEDATLRVSVAFGRRHGAASTNQLDPAAVAEVVARAEEIARLAPEDPEHVPPVGPARVAHVRAFDPATDRAPAGARVAVGAALLDAAAPRGLVASGFLELRTTARAVMTSTGHFAHHLETRARLSTTMRTRDGVGSGWARAASHRLGDLDPAALARTAAEKAERSRGARPLPPGEYPVILEPAAVCDALEALVPWLDARAADEGRSFFSRPGGGARLGERLFAERVGLRSDPLGPATPAAPFDGEGLPLAPLALIERGEVRELLRSRPWAAKSGRPATGDRTAWSLDAGGTGPLGELVRATERALLVTRLWYVRAVDPQTMVITGLTRDGLFLIERGEIAASVRNFRFNESLARLLSTVDGASAPVALDLGAGVPARVPALRAPAFTFSSPSDAV